MSIKQFFRPLKGCKIYASQTHHSLSFLTPIGVVTEVSGNIVHFKSFLHGDTDSMVWRFKDGNNSDIVFGA